MARDSKLVKSAGEHFVCSELARHGWAASLTRDGLERTDILAVHVEDRHMIEVQVKTAGPNPSWPVGAKGTIPAVSAREWYAMVFLGPPNQAPRCWLLPRDHLAACTWLTHMSWLRDPKAKPGTRNAGIDRARVVPWAFERYEGCWDLLIRPTDEIPVMLPRVLLDAAAKVGLPEGHPWRNGMPDWSDGGRPGETSLPDWFACF